MSFQRHITERNTNAPFARLHLFEFHDQPWYPKLLRNALTEWLRVLWEYTQAATVIAPILEETIRHSGSELIVDLCSGGSGPLGPVARQLELQGIKVSILATDKFSDAVVMTELSTRTGGLVTGSLESIDATQLPQGLTGVRTLFNSFHHFGPKLAREILQDAYAARQPIAIFEITERMPIQVLLSFPATFVSVFVLLPSMRPRRILWWVFTWVIPILPLAIAWDGLVSHLRSYTEMELARFVQHMNQRYSWSTRQVATPRAGFSVSYLVGRPT